MEFRRLLADLKTRGVYRVAAFYVAGSWALLQVADVVFPIFGLPDRAITSLLTAAAIGFPIALGLAWFFDLTSDGIAETDAQGPTGSASILTPARVVEIAVVVTLALLVGYLYFERLAMDRDKGTADAPATVDLARPAIAVMSFDNLSNDPDVEYLADGLAEEILTSLSGVQELDVASRSSSFRYKDEEVDARTIGEILAVSHVLEGSVRRSKDRVRVTAQLIDTRSGFRLWSQAFDRQYEDSFTIQDEIAQQVAVNLELILSDRSKKILSQNQNLNPEAYDFYLQGRDYLRTTPGHDSLDSAVSLFTRALEIDPDYAGAYAGLCDALVARYRFERDPQDFSVAEENCDRALALSTNAYPVLVALGNLYQVSGRQDDAKRRFESALSLRPEGADALLGLAQTHVLDGRFELAETTFQTVIKAHPSYWRAYNEIGSAYFGAGRFQEALPYFEKITALVPDDATAFNNLAAAHYLLGDFRAASRALERSIELQPSALAYANSGSSLFFLGQYEEAIDMYHLAVELAPEDFETWGALADSYYYLEGELREMAAPMYSNAMRLAREHLEINPRDEQTRALLAHYLARSGESEKSDVFIDQVLEIAPDDMYVNYNCALALTTLGKRERAIRRLDRALDLGYAPHLIALDAGFSELRGDQAFKDLFASD